MTIQFKGLVVEASSSAHDEKKLEDENMQFHA